MFLCWFIFGLFFYRVTDIQKKEKAKARPMALNTVEMLRVASSGLGMADQFPVIILYIGDSF